MSRSNKSSIPSNSSQRSVQQPLFINELLHSVDPPKNDTLNKKRKNTESFKSLSKQLMKSQGTTFECNIFII